MPHPIDALPWPSVCAAVAVNSRNAPRLVEDGIGLSRRWPLLEVSPWNNRPASSRRSLLDTAPILEMRSHKANVAGCGRLGKVACLIPESGKFDEFSETTIFDIQSGVWMSRALSHYLNQGNSGGS